MRVYVYQGEKVRFLDCREGRLDEVETCLTIIVGWDCLLGTFFAQVWDKWKGPDDHDSDLVFSVGLRIKEVQTIEHLNSYLTIFGGETPEVIEARLRQDQVNLTASPSAQAYARRLQRIIH